MAQSAFFFHLDMYDIDIQYILIELLLSILGKFSLNYQFQFKFESVQNV